MPASPAIERLRASARRLLLRYGTEAEFRRYERTPDWAAGSETQALTGDVVQAAISRDVETITRRGDGKSGDEKVRERRTIYHVEVGAFDAAGGLSDNWRVVFDGVERRIEAAVLCEDETYYEVRLTGG